MLTIRTATADDLPAISAIYNHYVATSTATFAMQPLSHAERLDWWRAGAGQLAVLVAAQPRPAPNAEGPGDTAGRPAEADAVIGWAALSPYSGRCGYRFTVESSVYVHPEHHRRGAGRQLLAGLLERAAGGGFHSVIAIIAAEQAASVRLHAALGFEQVGHLREVGHKFGRWIDVIFMQRML